MAVKYVVILAILLLGSAMAGPARAEPPAQQVDPRSLQWHLPLPRQ